MRTSVGPGGGDRRGAARSITSRCWPAMAPRRSTPIWPSTPSSRCCRRFAEKLSFEEAQKRYIKAVGKGLLKVMSKMGISTFQSYCGAQIFDAVGLNTRLRRPLFHRHPDHGRGHRPHAGRRGGGALARPGLRQRADLPQRTWTSAATTPSGCAARTTSGPRTPSPSSSTPPAPTVGRPTRSSRGSSTSRTSTC